MGSGFTGATRVTFGGVRATSFTVNSHYRITATRRRTPRDTKCAPLPATGVYAGENATNDICQVQVRVANANGTSATGHIRPPLEGAINVDSLGALVAPPRLRLRDDPGANRVRLRPDADDHFGVDHGPGQAWPVRTAPA